MPAELRAPADLIEKIRKGQCVAFVGSGFSAPVVGTWDALLRDLADDLDDDEVRQLLKTAKTPGNDLLEAAAQMLRDPDEERFYEAVRARLAALEQRPGWPVVRRRRKWLMGIPFSLVLTTNFDGVLEGELPTKEAYSGFLRGETKAGWWHYEMWTRLQTGKGVIKLHGDVTKPNLEASGLVFSRRDYRARLHEDPAYRNFLRAVFARSTVLYLGFSFTDAYVNELRSETLSLLGHRGRTDDNVAYAVMSDVAPAWARYMETHEGIGVLPYSSEEDPEHSSFDGFLEDVYERTNGERVLGALLRGKRVLWMDPAKDRNRSQVDVLCDAAGDPELVVQVSTPSEAVTRMKNASPPFDLVITHFGFKPELGDAAAEVLLHDMGVAEVRAPVIVFATAFKENRRRALRAGAREYTYRNDELFREIEQLFGD
jgi:hypothetical protein